MNLSNGLRVGFFLVFIFFTIGFIQAQDEEGEGADYDPFSDYSEFQQTAEEEADILFFRKGRLVTMQAHLGYRSFTGELSTLYEPDLAYGLGATFFFDLRFAAYLNFSTSDHNFLFKTPNTSMPGSVSVSFLSVGTKYYFNTDMLVRPLSDLYPHLILGMNQTYRSLSLATSPDVVRDNTLGLEIGFGIEIMTLRKESFIGIQAHYRYFNFADERQFLIDPVTQLPSQVRPFGDGLDLCFILGLNF